MAGLPNVIEGLTPFIPPLEDVLALDAGDRAGRLSSPEPTVDFRRLWDCVESHPRSAVEDES